jgi:hypothetical protein
MPDQKWMSAAVAGGAAGAADGVALRATGRAVAHAAIATIANAAKALTASILFPM